MIHTTHVGITNVSSTIDIHTFSSALVQLCHAQFKISPPVYTYLNSLISNVTDRCWLRRRRWFPRRRATGSCTASCTTRPGRSSKMNRNINQSINLFVLEQCTASCTTRPGRSSRINRNVNQSINLNVLGQCTGVYNEGLSREVSCTVSCTTRPERSSKINRNINRSTNLYVLGQCTGVYNEGLSREGSCTASCTTRPGRFSNKKLTIHLFLG